MWLFDLGMEGKVRAALAVSVGYGDADRAPITILPHTTSVRGSQYEIGVNVPFLNVNPAVEAAITAIGIRPQLLAETAVVTQKAICAAVG